MKNETNLARIRKLRGYTQEELARRAGISVVSIRNWEQGKRKVKGASFEHVCDLAFALDCDPFELIEVEE